MSYIGNELAAQFQAFQTQTITGDGSTGYTLDRAVANGKELLVYINNVKQEEGSGKAYTASGTTITFSEAVASTDTCYIVYMGLAMGTVTAPDGSIVSAQLANANLEMPNTLDMNGKELILDADADTSITADTDDRVDIKVGGSDMVHVTTTGLGVGTNAPNNPLDIVASNDGFALRITNNNDSSGGILVRTSDNDTDQYILNLQSSSSATGTDYASKVVVNKLGYVGIGTTSPAYPLVISTGASSAQLQLARPTDGSARSILIFRSSSQGADVGSVTVTNTGTAFNTSSDYRLKENIVTDWDATTRLKQLKPSRFNFKEHEGITVDGFLAHEVSGIVPEAISGEKDGVDADGNPVYQGIDQSKLVPLLVKTIQELEARIATLESK